MKLYPPVVHAYNGQLEPVIVVFEPHDIDEVSDHVPPTSQR